jgi:hypothetical protein
VVLVVLEGVALEQADDAAALAAAQELALPTGRIPAEVAGDLAARCRGLKSSRRTPQMTVCQTNPIQ